MNIFLSVDQFVTESIDRPYEILIDYYFLTRRFQIPGGNVEPRSEKRSKQPR